MRIGTYAERAIGADCGITWSDGRSLALIRRPLGGSSLYLNVLRHGVAAAVQVSSEANSGLRRLENWVENAMAAVGEAETQQGEMDRSIGDAELKIIHDDLWLPAHEFLLRHKILADTVGVGMDVLGVIAGGALVVAMLPVLGGSLAAVGTIGAVTGIAAGLGSVILLALDGQVLAAELSGDEAAAKRSEDDPKSQWLRIVATMMLLPDIPVGGPRALKELGALTIEARDAAMEAREAEAASLAQRARMNRVAHPEKHPHVLQRHADRAKLFAYEALEHKAAVSEAHRRMAVLTGRDLAASYAASPGSLGLLAGLPPEIMEGRADLTHDEDIVSLLRPRTACPLTSNWN